MNICISKCKHPPYLTVDLNAASNVKIIIKSKEADLPTPHQRGYITKIKHEIVKTIKTQRIEIIIHIEFWKSQNKNFQRVHFV